MGQKAKVLIIDDQVIALKNLKYVLEKDGFEVKATKSGVQALNVLKTEEFDLILTDLKMKKVDGMKILQEAKRIYPDTEVIMITGFATLDTAIEAMKKGAFHFISKPYKLDELRKNIADALEQKMRKLENARLKEDIRKFSSGKQIVTNNPRMQNLLKTAAQVAKTNCNVILLGESGTGKELLSRYLHANSDRANAPMLAINCGVFSEELLANELFGHEKGAYTGATEQKKGLVELADGGTLFLDEITEMSAGMQVKLLRVIQEKEIIRVGGTDIIHVNVRFVTATNRDLQEEVKEGRFRQDLFYRLNVVSLMLPSLAERRGDIPLLSHYFLQNFSKKMGKSVQHISDEVMEILMNYDFPGNIRELENIIERGVALANGDRVEISHIPEDLTILQIKTYRKKNGKFPTLEEQEKNFIQSAMQEFGGKKTTVADVLGIDRVSLWRKLKKYNLDP